LKEGISKEELKAVLPSTVSAKLFNMLLASLGKKKSLSAIRTASDWPPTLCSWRVKKTPCVNPLHRLTRKPDLTPPSLSDVVSSFKDQKTKAQTIVKIDAQRR